MKRSVLFLVFISICLLSEAYAMAAVNDSISNTGKATKIAKVPAVTVIVSGGIFNYNGTSHSATGYVYGKGGSADVLSSTPAYSYIGTGSTVYGPAATAPVNPGTYIVIADFAGNNDYGPAAATDFIVIKSDGTTAAAVNSANSNNSVKTVTDCQP